MAKNSATWEGRRALTDNSSTNAATFKGVAQNLIQLDQLAEAAVFGGLAQDDDVLGEIIDKAVAEGNFFIFNSAAGRLQGKSVSREQVQNLIAAAEKHGAYLYVEQAREYLAKKF